MNRFERINSPESHVEARETEEGYEVQSQSYRLLFEKDSPSIGLFDADGNKWMTIFRGSNIITSDSADTTYSLDTPSFEATAQGDIIVHIPSHNETGRPKEQTWVCRNDLIETYVTAEVSGNLEQVSLLGGTFVAPNKFGDSMSERYFGSVFNPQPSEMERRATSALESTHITTNGMWKPGRRREFLISPPVYGLNMSPAREDGSLPDGQWLMVGVSAPIEEQAMIDFQYDVHEDGFMFRLGYDSTSIDNFIYTSPSLLFHFAPDPYTGLKDYKKHAIQLGHLPEMPAPTIHPWHAGMAFVPWGQQKEQQSEMKQLGQEANAQDFSTEAFVTHCLSVLSEHGISPDILTLDDKWQYEYGTNTPDPDKWPNLARFTDVQHELGRRVLVWMKLFDAEGLPPELCIQDRQGRPIASDPTNPDYLCLLREQVDSLLSPSQHNADGLKLDFIAQLPYGPGLRWHGKERGAAALHTLLASIHDQAKQTKKDALIQAQVVHPWLADTIDQIRLNDVNEKHDVVKAMYHRALLATTLMPKHSISPDAWPLSGLNQWRQLIAVQPDAAGAVATFHSHSVNGERMTTSDYRLLERAALNANVINILRRP